MKHSFSYLALSIIALFLSYYPLKQGLKHCGYFRMSLPHYIFILLSIKTRIETFHLLKLLLQPVTFLSYYPLKQGLKPWQESTLHLPVLIFILLSIKTRIETHSSNNGFLLDWLIFILLSIKTRIETIRHLHPFRTSLEFLSYYPLKQGLKLHWLRNWHY